MCVDKTLAAIAALRWPASTPAAATLQFGKKHNR